MVFSFTQNQVEIIDYVKKYSVDKKKILVAVLHDLNMVMKYADKVLLLDKGKVVKYGGKEVLTSSELQNVYDMDIPKFMKDSYKAW